MKVKFYTNSLQSAIIQQPTAPDFFLSESTSVCSKEIESTTKIRNQIIRFATLLMAN